MRYAAPARLAYVVPQDPTPDSVVYIMLLPDGPPVVLTGSAALIWLAAAAGADDVVADVARSVGSEPADVAADISAYLIHLVDSGLLDIVDERVANEPSRPTPGL